MQIVPVGSSGWVQAPNPAASVATGAPSDVFSPTPPDPASLESRGPLLAPPEKAPAGEPPRSLVLESQASVPESGRPLEFTPLDPLRQTVFHHPDLLIARFARQMLGRSESSVVRHQDAYGPVEGCLEALQNPELADEALARLPLALGNRPPRPDVLWAVANQAREQRPAAIGLLNRWKDQGHLEFSQEVLSGPFQVIGQRLESSPGLDDRDSERDRFLEESELYEVKDRPAEVVSALVERCAARASEKDIKALSYLLDSDFSEPLGKAAAREHFEHVSTAITRYLGRGGKFEDSDVPFSLLCRLVKEFPERCDAGWVRAHLAPSLRHLDGNMGPLLTLASTEQVASLLDTALQDRPSTIADWRLTAAQRLMSEPDYRPTAEQSHWMSQFLILRPASDQMDFAAESLAVSWMSRLKSLDQEAFSQLQLPDLSGQMKPLPEALLARLEQRPSEQLLKYFDNPERLNALVCLPPEEAARLRAELKARPTFQLDLAVLLANQDRAALAEAVKTRLGTILPQEEDAGVRTFMQTLRMSLLKSPDEHGECLLRHQVALAYRPGHWMSSMRPSLTSALSEPSLDRKALLDSVSETLRAQVPGRLPELTDEQLLDFGKAVRIAEQEPEHLPGLLAAASPFVAWLPGRQDGPQVVALGSALRALEYIVVADDEWVKHCPGLRDGLGVLQQVHKIALRGGDLAGLPARAESAWLDQLRSSGPEWARTLAGVVKGKGELTEGLALLFESLPDLEEHGPLAARVAGLVDGDPVKTAEGVRAVLASDQSPDEALHRWLRGTMAGTGQLAVELDGLRPSVGGVLLRRKRT